jgi:hypothetical protein
MAQGECVESERREIAMMQQQSVDGRNHTWYRYLGEGVAKETGEIMDSRKMYEHTNITLICTYMTNCARVPMVCLYSEIISFFLVTRSGCGGTSAGRQDQGGALTFRIRRRW